MRYVDPREIIFPGICTRRGREGEGGGRREGRNEVFPPFVRRASFGSGEKTLQALLSLSYESMPDITLFAEFLLLREVFYSYVFSFIRTKLD